MADDFPETLSKTAGVPKTLFLKRKLRLDSLYFAKNTLMLSQPRGGIIVCILFLNLARFARVQNGYQQMIGQTREGVGEWGGGGGGRGGGGGGRGRGGGVEVWVTCDRVHCF